jgi:hypothetical protein
MDNTEAHDWAKDFENKEKSELLAMLVPEGLSEDAATAWWQARERAIDALEDAEERAVPVAEKPLPASREERVQMLLASMHDAEIRARERERDRAVAKHKPLSLPEGDAAMLLEKQIASSAALIGYLSNYVARTDTEPSVCMSFMDRMTAMLGASANVGKVVGRLRGQVSRSEQLINVNHMEGERGRG